MDVERGHREGDEATVRGKYELPQGIRVFLRHKSRSTDGDRALKETDGFEWVIGSTSLGVGWA
jgi:hypothetical protein